MYERAVFFWHLTIGEILSEAKGVPKAESKDLIQCVEGLVFSPEGKTEDRRPRTEG